MYCLPQYYFYKLHGVKDLIENILSVDFDADSKSKYTTNGIALEPQNCLRHVCDFPKISKATYTTNRTIFKPQKLFKCCQETDVGKISKST